MIKKTWNPFSAFILSIKWSTANEDWMDPVMTDNLSHAHSRVFPKVDHSANVARIVLIDQFLN